MIAEPGQVRARPSGKARISMSGGCRRCF